MKWLTIDKCPQHGIYAISINDAGGGSRLSPSKCCGRWERVQAWPMTVKELLDMANEIEYHAADLMDEE